VLRYDRPFNYSAINNVAASQARGEVLCLLNNDTEVISPDWMEDMLGYLTQSRVGVVGAKLLYPDGRIQHAGDAVGVGGVANHLHAFIGRESPGYCSRAVLAQDLSAVTAACMMTWRTLFVELGGLDEEHLKVNFNDVDYCLRAREAGYRVIWTPHAELYHHESVSRGSDDTPGKRARAKAEAKTMRIRWRHVMQHDPFYNPNLSYERADFSLSHAPLVQRPWQRRRWIGGWR
jgi:GT2 family glycosyltransferase